MSAVFIKINEDIFNVNKIQSISYEDQKNCLGNDSGVYILHIWMEGNIGSQHKAYASKERRDKDFTKAKDQLVKFGIKNVTYNQDVDGKISEEVKTNAKSKTIGRRQG